MHTCLKKKTLVNPVYTVHLQCIYFYLDINLISEAVRLSVWLTAVITFQNLNRNKIDLTFMQCSLKLNSRNPSVIPTKRFNYHY